MQSARWCSACLYKFTNATGILVFSELPTSMLVLWDESNMAPKKKIHVRCNYCLLCQKPVDIKSTSASELESCFDNARKTTNTISSFVIYYSHMELSYLPRWFIHLPCHLICLSFCWLISPDCVERNELLTSLDRLSVCPVGVVVAIVSENNNNNNNNDNILCASSALA